MAEWADIALRYGGPLLVLALSLTVHEWGHAACAVALGDSTPRDQGRLTLNPLAHLDPIGSVLVPLVLLATFASTSAGGPIVPLVGWARPVVFAPYRFTRRLRLTTGMMLAAAAGPLMNLVLAAVAAMVLAGARAGAWWLEGQVPDRFLASLVAVNIVLALFNLIPLPPFDGSRVVAGALPSGWRPAYARLDRLAPLFLAVLLLTDLGALLVRAPSLWVSDVLATLARLLFAPGAV